MQNVTDLFLALSDETRLRIVNLLMTAGELCVCDIHGLLDLSQPKVSRHLSFLKLRGVLNDRSVGLWSMYSINEAVITPTLVSALHELFEQDIKYDDDIRRLGEWVDKRCCATFVSVPGIKIPKSLSKNINQRIQSN